MKKTVLHIIESLARGGAETLLVGSVNDLKEYNNIVVYLKDPSTVEQEFIDTKVIFLNYKGKFSILTTILKLRKIIKENKVDIVHSHLLWPTIIARLATPNEKLVFTIHNLYSKDAFEKNRLSLYAERLTYNKKQTLIATSHEALKDYKNFLNVGEKSYVVENFVEDKYFCNEPKKYNVAKKELRLIAVGNLRAQKNYGYLIEAFKEMKDLDITLDIYGEGHLMNKLNEQILANDLKVSLKGSQKNIEEVLLHYDVYVMSSYYEGFGIAAMEAMASGLPVMLSDIPVLREISDESAIFFDIANPNDFVSKIIQILNGSIDVDAMAEKGLERSNKIGRKSQFTNSVKEIYSRIK